MGAYNAALPLMKGRRMDYRQNILRNMMEGDPVFWGNAIAFYDREKKKLLARDIAPENGGGSYDLVRRRLEKLAAAKKPDAEERIVYWELKNRLAELLLMRVDKVTMATSIEARVPFLDHALVEFSMNIPGPLKTKNGVTKYILKKALRGVIPDEIIDRKKIGFAGSGKNMLTREIYAHAKDLILTSRHGYFDKNYLRGFFGEYERTGINYTPQIWTLYNFELWWRQWIDGG
jgi:asparagine synthase (glutamine-hydrolysing)